MNKLINFNNGHRYFMPLSRSANERCEDQFKAAFFEKNRRIIFVCRFCSSNARSIKLVVLIAFQCFAGNLRCCKEASMSSLKLAKAEG